MRALVILISLLLVFGGGCIKKDAPQPTPSAAVGTDESPSPSEEIEDDEPPEPPPPRRTGPMTLREFYVSNKYDGPELYAVQKVVKKLLTGYDTRARRQAEAEIMAFHYVVFHTTRWHHLDRNHALIRKFEPTLKELCELHKVPFLPVLAIVSWENSGDVDKVSWADAAGLGQMTWGAVGEAHEYAAAKARKLRDQARWKKYMAGVTQDPKAMREARELASLAERYDIRSRHRKMAKEAGVADERSLVECNLEDVVVFYEFLLSKYGGRRDHAIAAYHKGVTNQDDIVYDYLKRQDSTVLYPEGADRQSFIDAMNRYEVTYLTLWNDPRSREMLNGLRTVEGEVTGSHNAHMALGDESDIYPWKVMGSLAAYLAGPEHLNKMIARYDGDQPETELKGLTRWESSADVQKGTQIGRLIPVAAPVVGAEQALVTPELNGYLQSLTGRMRRVTGKDSLRLAARHLGVNEGGLYTYGATAGLTTEHLSERDAHFLRQLLKRDYLADRIYWREKRDHHEVTLNPRFGNEFLAAHQKYKSR